MTRRPRRATMPVLLVVAASACVGLPPSPPEGAGTVGATGTSSGGTTTEAPETNTTSGTTSSVDGDVTTLELSGTSTGEVSDGSASSASSGGVFGSSGSTAVGSSDSGPSPSCNELFGSASGYVLCLENETSCSFNANTGGVSCDGICGSFGAVCLDAIDNPSVVGQECIAQGMSFCANAAKGTTICVCSK